MKALKNILLPLADLRVGVRQSRYLHLILSHMYVYLGCVGGRGFPGDMHTQDTLTSIEH